MSGLLTDSDGLVLPLQIASEAQYVKQHIEVRLRMVKGEWFKNLDAGTPWFANDIVSANEAIMGQVDSLEKARPALLAIIQGTPGVAKAELVSASFEGRDLSVSYKATLYSDELISDEVTV